MKILVVSAWCPYPADNGSRLRAFHLIKRLSDAGHRLSLIAFGQDDSDLQAAEAGMRPLCAGGVTLYPSRFFRPGTLKAWLGYFSPKPRMLLDTWQPAAAREIAQQCRSGAYDVVLALQLGIAHYIPVGTRTPCVLEEVEVSSFLREWETTRSLPKKIRLGLMATKFRAHVASLASRFQLWTTVSEAERQAILKHIGTRSVPPIVVLPNGVDLAYNDWKPDAPYDPESVIYNGALSFYANREAVEDFCRETLPLLHQTHSDARLIVTGRTDALPPDDALLDTPNLHLTGYLDDIRPAVRGALACVVPLRKGGGTRLKILEAMALGTPVVSTPQGAEGIGARDGSEILIADTPQEFSQAIDRLMTEQGLRHRLAESARRLVEERFGWDAIGQDLDSQLTELAAPTAPARQEPVCL